MPCEPRASPNPRRPVILLPLAALFCGFPSTCFVRHDHSMIDRSPAEAYLKYLVTHPKHSIADVVRIAREKQIFFVGRTYLERLKSAHPTPTPFRPEDRKHKPSQMFLFANGIWPFYDGSIEMRDAFRILDAARPRELTECMLLGRIVPREIRLTLRALTNMKVAAGAIKLYHDAFWNLGIIDRRSIIPMLDLQLEECLESDDPAVRRQYKHLKRAARLDPRRLAASLPSGEFVGPAVLSRIGVGAHVNVPAVLDKIRSMALIQAGVAVCSGTARDAKKAETLLRAAQIASELHATVEKPEDRLAEDLRKFTMKYDDERSKTFDEVCGAGNYTTNVMPEEQPGQAPS